MITKSAEAILLPHQQRVIDKLYSDDTPGVVAYHSMGSGKTLTALEALRRAHGDKLVITPASLVENIHKESKKHGIPLGKNTQVMSYEKASKQFDKLKDKDYGLVVLDEAHRIRNKDKSQRARDITELLNKANKKLLLTGTAGYNHPADLMNLVSALDPNIKVPTNSSEFAAKYIDPKTWNLKNTNALKNLSKYIDVYDTERTSIDFPTVTEETVHVPMSDIQKNTYRLAAKKLPPHLYLSMRKNLPLSLQDTANLNVFATGMRQASTSPTRLNTKSKPEDSTKLVAAADSMAEHAKAPHFRGVAYSNYLDSGLVPYAELLRKRGLDPLVYTGGLNAKQKKELIDKYNATGEDPRILLLSSSGAEGLDLKGTRLMQILEPHFNQAKIDQVTARGARYKSHAHLPESERNMQIERYLSTMPPNMFQKLLNLKPDTAIDDYLFNASRKKQAVIDQLKALLSNSRENKKQENS